MAIVLALEPDVRQAMVLKRVIKEHVGAELTVVDSRDGALAAIAERMPDVILLTALLSPRDEEELFSRLRAMARSGHVQTHTIPPLASAAWAAPEEHGGGGVFGKLRRKKAEPQPIPGCDPDLFAEEVVTFLQRAAELKISGSTLRTRDGDDEPLRPAEPRPQVEVHAEPAAPPAEAGSAWSSPFEWRPATESRSAAPPAAANPVVDPHAHEDVEGRIARAALREADMAAERIRVEADREAERLRMEAERVVEREKERARVEAEREKERLRVEAEREKERLRVEAERQAEKLRVEAERQKLEAQRQKEAAEREAERVRAEAERQKLEADAAAARRREAERLREEAAKEKERLRKQAEQEKERLRKEAEERRIAAEREAERVRREAEREAERLRLEAERHRVEAERQKAAAEREKERLRLEAERQKVEAERRKFEAEAAATRQREAERLRQEAQREAERLRVQAEQEKKDAEQQKIKAQREAERLRQEAERQKKEAEVAAARQREAERLRLEAERRKEDAEREADRLREEALREAERLRAQAEEEAERARAEEAIAAAKTQEEARERRDAETARKRSAERARKHKEAVHDAFAEFREDPVEHPRGAIRLVPLSVWARFDTPPARPPDTARDELRELMKGLSIPLHVAGVAYAGGCRIRRVRVPSAPPAKGRGHKGPVILSRRALDEARSGEASS